MALPLSCLLMRSFLYLALSFYSSLYILDMNAISEMQLTKILSLLFSFSELIFCCCYTAPFVVVVVVLFAFWIWFFDTGFLCIDLAVLELTL